MILIFFVWLYGLPTNRSLEHSTIIYESPDYVPLLRLCWNKQDHNYLATFLMDHSQVVILDIRYVLNWADSLTNLNACFDFSFYLFFLLMLAMWAVPPLSQSPNFKGILIVSMRSLGLLIHLVIYVLVGMILKHWFGIFLLCQNLSQVYIPVFFLLLALYFLLPLYHWLTCSKSYSFHAEPILAYTAEAEINSLQWYNPQFSFFVFCIYSMCESFIND